MKRLSIHAVILLVLGLVVAIGSLTFLGACVHEDGSFGACHWAARALLGEGCLAAALGLLALFVEQARLGLYLASALNAILGLLTPGTLIAICGMDAMRCRMVMKPAMTVLWVLALAVAAVGCAMEYRRVKRG